MRRRGFESLPVLLFFDNSAHHVCAHDVAAACRLAMAEVRVRLPLGAFQMQDVGKPGIPRASGARDRGFKSRRPDFDCGGACVGTGGRLLSVMSQVRFLPPQPWIRKVKPTGDGSRPESGRAMSLGGSTPSPSALTCPWPSGRGASLPSWRGGFDSHRALLDVDRGSASGRPPGLEPGRRRFDPSSPNLQSASRVSLGKRCGVI